MNVITIVKIIKKAAIAREESFSVGITLLGYYAASIPALKDSSRAIAAFFIILTIVITVKNYIRARRD